MFGSCTYLPDMPISQLLNPILREHIGLCHRTRTDMRSMYIVSRTISCYSALMVRDIFSVSVVINRMFM